MKHLILLTFTAITFMAQSQDMIKKQLLDDFKRAKDLTLIYAEAMPADQYQTKPGEGSMTFAEQLLHLAGSTSGLLANGTGDERLYKQNIQKVEEFQTKEECIRLLKESFDYSINSLEKMNPQILEEIVERGQFKITRLGWILKSYEHMVHHRGQCAVYLRTAGIETPGYQLF